MAYTPGRHSRYGKPTITRWLLCRRTGNGKLALAGVLARRWFILRFPPILARRRASMLAMFTASVAPRAIPVIA